MLCSKTLLIALPALLLIGCNFNDDPLEDVIDTPTVSLPSENAAIGTPVVVTGTAIAGAAVDVSVTLDQAEIGIATVFADEDGNFSATVPFAIQDEDTMLLICVTQANGDGNSPVAVRQVIQAAPN